jgi:hypothetical protein
MCARVARNWPQLNKPLASWKRVPLCGGRSRAKPGRCSIIHSSFAIDGRSICQSSIVQLPSICLLTPSLVVNTTEQAEVIMTCPGRFSSLPSTLSTQFFVVLSLSRHIITLVRSESASFVTFPNQNLSIRHKYNRGKTTSCLLYVALLLCSLGRVCSAMWHVILYWTTILSSFTSECSSSV